MTDHPSAVDIDDAVAELLDMHASGAERPDLWGRQFDLGLAWPSLEPSCGGRLLDGGTAGEVERRLREAGLPHPRLGGFVGVSMAGPLIARHGSPEQKHRYMRRIFTGEDLWCQLFSEPGAGSDIANVSTQAVRDGEQWIVNGQKVWNSYAHNAQHGLLVTRTHPDLPKHRGMTFFLADMSTAGIEPRPLRMMTGDAEFNEVFLTDVALPDSDRIGDVGGGWAMTLDVLLSERAAVGSVGEGRTGRRADDRIRDRAAATLDAVSRDRLASLLVVDEVQRWTKRRAATSARQGNAGSEGAVLRILTTELNADIHEFGIDSGGPHGTLLERPYPAGDDIAPPQGWELTREFLFSRGLRIGGGTIEIARNVLGERVLGLPGEPRVDKDLPWKDQAR